MHVAGRTDKTTRTTQARRIQLNSDGKRHPLLNAATAFTLLTGVASFPLGLIVATHLPATVLGLSALAVGFSSQMLSATREERLLIVPGIIAGFVGMALGLAHGGWG